MSRIGKKPIRIPEGVEVTVRGSTVTVSGPKGRLSRTLPDRIAVSVEGSQLTTSPRRVDSGVKPLWGLSRALIRNMVEGVTSGFGRELELVGVGYRARLEGDKKLVLNIGYTVPVEVIAPEGIIFEVVDNTRVKVFGIDKSLVGQVAAYIREKRPPEPYKGKGIRYVGEVVRRKAGKAAKVGGGLGAGG